MGRLFSSSLTDKTPMDLSLEQVREEIEFCNKVISKLNNIKSNRRDANTINRDTAYVNGFMLKYNKSTLKLSVEENIESINTKIEESENNVNDVKSNLLNKETDLKNTQELSEQKQETTEIEPIKKYPLNEKTLTMYALTSPNLLTASTVAVKGNNELGEAPTVVELAKSVLDNAATNENMVKVVNEHYNKDLSLIDNVHNFFNSHEGRLWLESDKGKSWVEYIANKNHISLESTEETSLVDEDSFEDANLDVIISMESINAAEADYLVNSVSDADAPAKVNELVPEETLEALNASSDKISRLEESIDLVTAGIDNIDNIQMSSSVTLEAAVTYNTVLTKLGYDVSKSIDYRLEPMVSISKEDMKFDPVGSLSIAREGLVAVLHEIYEFFKRIILKIVKFFKKLFNRSVLSSKLISAKAKAIQDKLKGKGEISADKFETIKLKLTEKCRGVLFAIDFDLSNGSRYLQSLYNSTLRKNVAQPLKDVYNTMNKLSSDVNVNKADAIGEDINNILHTMDKENIINKIFSNRNKFMPKIDGKLDVKSDKEYLVLFAGVKKANVLAITESDTSKGKLYRYDIYPVPYKSIQGMVTKTPRKNDLLEICKELVGSSKTIDAIYKDNDQLFKYAGTFIDSFKKFTKGDKKDTTDNKEATASISSVVSYAKTVIIKYGTTEMINYVHNAKTFLYLCNACSECVE